MSILTVTYVTEAPNTVIRSSRWNTNFDDITTFINNKNQDSTDNIADGGISTAALANLAVTDAKIAGITSANKVSGAALYSLSSTSSGAGALPAINGGVPTGAIFMWSGTIASIPSGYYFCDGTNGTPDLRDMCIVGARQDSGGVAKTNVSGSLTQSGGEATHTLTTPEIPAHTHDINMRNSNGFGAVVQNSDTQNQSNTVQTGTTGGGGSHNNLQPYYALGFIMKN